MEKALSSQYPDDNNYPSNPDWQNSQQQQSSYGQDGYSQPPTQYEQPSYTQPDPYAQSNPYAQPLPDMYAAPNPYGAMAPQYAPRTSDSRTGFAIAGLVLGIISILSSWYPFCGLPLPILGIVMSALGRRSLSYRTMATVGLILSIIAIAIGVITTTALLFFAVNSSTTTP
jgi:hypothetical protein